MFEQEQDVKQENNNTPKASGRNNETEIKRYRSNRNIGIVALICRMKLRHSHALINEREGRKYLTVKF